MAKKKSLSSTSIETVKHQDKRANIPTEELKDFMGDEQKKPKVILYPRDTSLDPQLVWKGKDEQDQHPLEVPALPMYIQEKVHPQSIIQDFRTYSQKQQSEVQLSLFSDFNGLKFDQLIDFYQHKEGIKWANRMILGDSLLVMNSLAEKEGLKGKVQMIYLDPPYGIKFGSNWQVSTKKRDVKDGSVGDATRQPEQIKAFRDTWELGINSYLAYLRDRLVVARELLTETGSVFVQIGDENVHLVRCLLDEVFGSENFVCQIAFKTTAGKSSGSLDSIYDVILWYAFDIKLTKFRQLYLERQLEDLEDRYKLIEQKNGSIQTIKIREFYKNNHPDIDKVFCKSTLNSQGETTGKNSQIITWRNKNFYPPKGRHWTISPLGIQKLAKSNRLMAQGDSLFFKKMINDYPFQTIKNVWMDTGAGILIHEKLYVVQTITKVIERCILMTTDPGDLVLDPTMGSATTAYVAEQWGRRWITIDTSRVALALARTRLMSAKYPYYLLADSPEGIQKEAEVSGQLPPTQLKTENDIRKGFVYKRVPHLKLGAIANNPEIDPIHEKWQQQLEPVHTQLNQLLKNSWEEWEIPREPDPKWSQETKDLLTKWWELRQKRQKEIDDSIARYADTEILYDQPYEDNKRLRVTGPFTVESLSPHRVLSTDEERPTSEAEGQQQASDQFEIRIIENLKKAGVQNTIKNERLKFDFLEPHAGTWLQATGEYTDKDEIVKRVAVSIGPEYGTVGSEQIKEAAKEAVKGVRIEPRYK